MLPGLIYIQNVRAREERKEEKREGCMYVCLIIIDVMVVCASFHIGHILIDVICVYIRHTCGGHIPSHTRRTSSSSSSSSFILEWMISP